jgi:hypothetical protein
VAAERTFCGYALKAPAPRSQVVTLDNGPDRHETDVVPIACVPCARIAQPDQEQHARALFRM